MNKTTKFIILIGFSTLVLLGVVATTNYIVDPMCFYHCQTVDLQRKTENVYYQAAQTAAANPDAEVIILGSSRGETTPSKWIEDITGLKTINLSQGGADLLLKVALVNTSLDVGAKLKKVLWIVDYFELSRETTDIKVKITPVLAKYSSQNSNISRVSSNLGKLQRLIDHLSIEATMSFLAGKEGSEFRVLGNGSDINYQSCISSPVIENADRQKMEKEISSVYGRFSTFLQTPQDAEYWAVFENQVKQLEQKNIEVLLFIPPYHPEFMARFNKDFPEAGIGLKQWRQRVAGMATDKVKVLDYFDGVPGDNGGPSFWSDGVHMTCKSIIAMLGGHL